VDGVVVAKINKPLFENSDPIPLFTPNLLKVVVIDCYHETSNRGIGFVKGFGLKSGDIACTTNFESQNLVVIGTSDSEIAFAAEFISKLGGGISHSHPEEGSCRCQTTRCRMYKL
jgi:adenine deaminase